MQLNAYLARIGYKEAITPTLECLTAIHRCHALAIPYENLDVQLGVPVSQRIGAIYDKIVTRRRGGWCYEMNGLLGWALREIGFDVMRVASGVRRKERGDSALGNHLVLLVRLERTYLADLGLGDGIREPIPLEEGTFRQGSLEFRLELLADSYWRFHNHAFANPPTADFRAEPANEDLLQAKMEFLQSSPESVFVQNLAFEIMRPQSLTSITGCIFAEKSAAGVKKAVLKSSSEMTEVLARDFGIRDVSVAPIWPKIEARHRELFGHLSPEEFAAR
jgi:N-hydroxyarylamine O-acetyltransferase